MITGPFIEPSSGNQPKQVVIFVHGYGADGNDLIGLANNSLQKIEIIPLCFARDS